MIIEVVGKEIEKIKGDFESYLNGLNMVGEISYSQYSELYDEGTKQIQRAYELGRAELEKENAELKGLVNQYKASKCSGISLANRNMIMSDQLTKAKDILQRLMENQPTPSSMYAEIDLVGWREVNKEAKQFLKEIK